MQNPFTAHQQFESKPKRNAFDNSHRCFMTGKLGCLYPVMNLEVSAGDSVQIDSSFLFNFFPMVFPVQTPLRASIYFFYGRNRIFWKNWMDFAYNNKQPSHPFILQPQGDFWKTGSLADYLGVPTTYSRLASTFSSLVRYAPTDSPSRSQRIALNGVFPFVVVNDSSVTLSRDATSVSLSDIRSGEYIGTAPDNAWFWMYEKVLSFDDVLSGILVFNRIDSIDPRVLRYVVFCEWSDGEFYPLIVSGLSVSSNKGAQPTDSVYFSTPGGSYVEGYTLSSALRSVVDVVPSARFYFSYITNSSTIAQISGQLPPLPFTEDSFYGRIDVDVASYDSVDLSELDTNPFAGTSVSSPAIPLNAIPFRFYEAVYNAYFRNERNDPFMVDGEIEYNKWNTTLEDGADSTPYKLYFRNWEADFLTTATQTPQQGLAPLVGINVRGDMEFLNEDGTISRIRPTIAEDGTTITGIAGVVENGTKEAMRSAMELITSGISINDFRQVSSLQSWLENNLRKGLKYKDQVAANTGVKIRYDELDMPEFIGGFSRPVQVTSITQATPSTAEDNALGDRAGQASVFGGSNHKISHYCDEAGFIMAIMCVYPQPVYTQLLPKYFLKSDALSYYHPQFGSIGLQPISYREVCPVQAFFENKDLDDTFGYQRPWYDLIANVDEAHGNMRTNMKNYLMHRTFAGVPVLGRDFLKIDPKQLNNVFSITDDTEDVYQGQIAFNIYTKRAIPRFGIPRQI